MWTDPYRGSRVPIENSVGPFSWILRHNELSIWRLEPQHSLENSTFPALSDNLNNANTERMFETHCSGLAQEASYIKTFSLARAHA